MDFDFSEDFGTAALPETPETTPLQKLRQQWSNRKPSRRLRASPRSMTRPQELFPSPRQGQSSSPAPGSPLSAMATPNEDAFVSTKASVRRREYEKLEMWISSAGAVDDFAPWFREMLADPDDDCLVSALRSVAAHYRRAAQQQALGEEGSGAPVPVCWLAPLAERLMSCESGLVAHEASELVAACLACTEQRWSSEHQATFFQRFATLSRGKVHLLAACQGLLQPEDWQEMLRLVRQGAPEELSHETWRRLPEELKNLAQELEPTVASPLPARPTEDGEAWHATPKTWRQRVRCLEHLAERGDVRNLWPQLVLQVEDDHPAVSAAALHCLARLAPQMTPPAEHLLCRLAHALRQRLREPRCRMRRAALELLRSMQGAAQGLLLAQTFGVSKERARKAALGMKRSLASVDGIRDDPLEILMIEAFGDTKFHQGAPGTPSPVRTRGFWSASPQKATPPSTAATTPGTGRMKLTNLTPETEETPSPMPKAVQALDLELRGSCALPSESTLLSFEATPQRPEESPCSSTAQAATCRSDDKGREGEASLIEPRSASPHESEEVCQAQTQDSDHAELTWSFQKIHMITLELGAGGDEVAWRQLGQLLSRAPFQGPLRRFLARWRQRQRRRARVKENLAPGKPSKSLRMDDYASLRELCSDEDLPGSFPHSVLSQLRKTLETSTARTARPTAAVLSAAVEALEKCVTACGPAFRPWQRFAVPLLRLAAQQHGLRRSVAAALLSSADALRRTWRSWMQVCESSGTTDQALVAESLQLLASGLGCGPVPEMPGEVLHDILRVACSYLEASRSCVSSRAVTVAAQRCLQMLGTRLGPEQMMKDVSLVAPGLNLDAFLTGPVAKPPVQVALRGRATRSLLPAEVKEVELDSGRLATAKATLKEGVDQAQIRDERTLRSPSSMPSPDLRRQSEDLSSGREVPSRLHPVLHALSEILRLCTKAAGDEATAATALQAAHEEMLAQKAVSEEILKQLEPVPLFRCLLQLLLQLESCQGDLRRSATPILLEVAPFLARAMEAIEMGKQLLAWLELASEVMCDQGERFDAHARSLQLSAAKRTWALRFCARAAERCGSALAEGDAQLAWEALAKLASISDPGNAEAGLLEALCTKIVELYPSQARDFAKLTGAWSSESWLLKLIQQEELDA